MSDSSATPPRSKFPPAAASIPPPDTETFLPGLRRCPAFAGLDDTALARVACHMGERTLSAGQILFEQNETAHDLYIIDHGTLLLYLPWGDEELPLVSIEQGEMFGEAEYFEASARSASARATSSVRLLRLPFAALPRLFEELPTLYPPFVAQRLSETSKRFRQSVQRSRVAERSLRQLNEFLDMTDLSSLDEGSLGLIKRIVLMASKVMKADRASLFLLNPETGDLWSKVAMGEGSRTIVVPRGKGIAGHVLATDELLNIADVYADPRFNRETDIETGYRTKNMLCGPVKNARGRCVGVIQVINKLVGSFNDEDIALFRAFSHQAAVAVENFFLFQQLRTSNQQMEVMLDVLNAVTATGNMAALIGKVIEKTITIVACERASFFVLDRAGGELWSLKAVGENLEEIRFPASKGVAGKCVREDRLLNIPDAYANAEFNPEIDQKTGFRTRNLLVVPVHDRAGAVIGVVEAINKIGSPFGEHDEDLIQAIASQLGEAIKKASMLDELKKSNLSLSSNKLDLEREISRRLDELHASNAALLIANRELKEISERKSELLGIAAHDLRNPMGAISQLTDLLTEHCAARSEGGTLAPGEEAEFLEMIQTSARTMLATLEDIMNTESLDAATPRLMPECMDFGAAVLGVVGMNRPNADAKSIHVSVTLPEVPVNIHADPRRLREVLDNLISNALKYSPPGLRVWVSVERLERKDERVRLSVKDEGPGLQSSDLKRVFGKFQKLSARPTGKESSSGLGLYIVKKLVELHAGTVWVESVHGQGATFYVELPALKG